MQRLRLHRRLAALRLRASERSPPASAPASEEPAPRMYPVRSHSANEVAPRSVFVPATGSLPRRAAHLEMSRFQPDRRPMCIATVLTAESTLALPLRDLRLSAPADRLSN